jgi:hypothetical protein
LDASVDQTDARNVRGSTGPSGTHSLGRFAACPNPARRRALSRERGGCLAMKVERVEHCDRRLLDRSLIITNLIRTRPAFEKWTPD